MKQYGKTEKWQINQDHIGNFGIALADACVQVGQEFGLTVTRGEQYWSYDRWIAAVFIAGRDTSQDLEPFWKRAMKLAGETT